MSIVEETRIVLLELFPEQAAADAEARIAAEAESAAQAEIEAAAAEMDSMDPAADAPAEDEEGGEAEVEVAEETPAPESEPEDEPEEEGPRENGVMVTEFTVRGTHLDVLCDPDQVAQAAEIMDEAGFFLEAVTGVDWMKEDKMEVIYDYNQSGMEQCRVVVRTFIPRSAPEIPTLTGIFPSAHWHERETHDFFGIKFLGHPYLVPLLLPEDADFHPLLKDFKP